MSKELRELLKPPFSFDNSELYLNGNIFITINHRIRDTAEQDLIDVEDFITAAMNDKAERELKEPDENVDCFDCRHYFTDEEDLDRCRLKGNSVTVDPEIKEPCSCYDNKKIEPLRWKPAHCKSTNTDYIYCPKCQERQYFADIDFNYCPHCGQRLLPPEKT